MPSSTSPGFEDLPLSEGVDPDERPDEACSAAGSFTRVDFSGGRLFAVHGNNVRVRGLRLRGPSGYADEKNDGVAAIGILRGSDTAAWR